MSKPAERNLIVGLDIGTSQVKAVVGDYAHVIGLMGPNVDPHLYRAREGDVHRLACARSRGNGRFDI